jgi:hypothetical protein
LLSQISRSLYRSNFPLSEGYTLAVYVEVYPPGGLTVDILDTTTGETQVIIPN